MTTLSIIIPIYNQELYLSQCLESVLSQRFSDFEVIAVDDGSTDTSSAILEQYAKKDRRVKIVSKENGGYGSAMNTGLLNVRGIYIGIVEPDDTILPQMYEELIAKAEQMQISSSVHFKGSSPAAFGWRIKAGITLRGNCSS